MMSLGLVGVVFIYYGGVHTRFSSVTAARQSAESVVGRAAAAVYR